MHETVVVPLYAHEMRSLSIKVGTHSPAFNNVEMARVAGVELHRVPVALALALREHHAAELRAALQEHETHWRDDQDLEKHGERV